MPDGTWYVKLEYRTKKDDRSHSIQLYKAITDRELDDNMAGVTLCTLVSEMEQQIRSEAS